MILDSSISFCNPSIEESTPNMCLYSLLFYAFVQQIQVIQFYSMSLKSRPGTLILQPSQEPVSSSKTRNMWHHHTPIETSEDQPHSSSAHAP